MPKKTMTKKPVAENAMPEPAQEAAQGAAQEQIVRNLALAIERLQQDLDRVELWTAALDCFQRPVPDYRPAERYLLPVSREGRGARP